MPLSFLTLTHLLAIGDGRVPDISMKETAKRSQALKTHFKANISHPNILRAEQFLCLLDSAFDQILVGRFIKGLAKESEEMVTRKTGLARYLLEIERVIIAVIDKLARPRKAFEDIRFQRLCGGIVFHAVGPVTPQEVSKSAEYWFSRQGLYVGFFAPLGKHL